MKPSDRLSVEIPPFRGNVNIQSGPSHQYISPVYSNGTGHNKWKDELTLPEVKVVSRSRLRLVHCQWADEGEKKCDATLASYNLFRKACLVPPLSFFVVVLFRDCADLFYTWG